MLAYTDAPCVVVVSDLHAGSKLAPCPQSLELWDDTTFGASRLQKWLWDCWQHFTDEYLPAVLKKRKYVIVINGDTIEGFHHGGKQIVSADEGVHLEIAYTMLKPLAAKAEAVFMTEGTECHTKDHEQKLAEKLGTERCTLTGAYAPAWLDLDVRGCLTSFRHHIGTTSRRALAATQYSVQLVEEQAEAAGSLERIPRVIVRAHRHKPGGYTDFDGATYVTPSWQALTRHGHKVVGTAERSLKMGGMVLDYENFVDEHDLPVCHAKIYRCSVRKHHWKEIMDKWKKRKGIK